MWRVELSPEAEPCLGSCFTHSTVTEKEGQLPPVPEAPVLPADWEHDSWHHLTSFHTSSATRPSVHVISCVLGHFCHFAGLCSGLINLMEGKSNDQRPTLPQALPFLPAPFFHFFYGQRLISMPPNPQNALSIVLKLHWLTFPSVNGFWLAGAIYCCLWQGRIVSPLGQGRLESLAAWAESPAMTL